MKKVLFVNGDCSKFKEFKKCFEEKAKCVSSESLNGGWDLFLENEDVDLVVLGLVEDEKIDEVSRFGDLLCIYGFRGLMATLSCAGCFESGDGAFCDTVEIIVDSLLDKGESNG